MTIHFVDLDAQYQSIKSEVKAAIDGILETKDFIHGKSVEKFSKNFAAAQGSKYVVGASNGTSAITVALRALGVGPGDEVITVANSFFATPEAIAEVYAKPIFVDCDADTYSIDISQIEAKITKKTKAIIPVHLYGNPVDMDALMKIANKHNIPVIEDCAQAHLATWNGKGAGTFGAMGTFSFYPGKNLGAYGDAGAITVQDDKLHQLVAMHVNHGRTKKYEHDFCAGNFRMDGIQAAVLDVKLKHLAAWTKKRQELAAFYESLLKPHGFKTIGVKKEASCVYHIYLVEVSNRDEVMEHFKKMDIHCGVHYPIPLHLQPALSHLEYKKGDFPVTEKAAERILSLPMYAELTRDEVKKVCDELIKVAKK
ncbi:MAG: DegT/DnrJ/EryC1/StrS family aminotransferase [Bacteriovoracaceae bacterium]